MKTPQLSGSSFKQLRDLQSQVARGNLVIQTPAEIADKRINDAVAELSHLWQSRKEYAVAFVAAGMAPDEAFAKAEELTALDHRDRTGACLELFRIHGGEVPDGLKYAAHVLGIDVEAVTGQKNAPTSPETAHPATNGSESVNLHG